MWDRFIAKAKEIRAAVTDASRSILPVSGQIVGTLVTIGGVLSGAKVVMGRALLQMAATGVATGVGTAFTALKAAAAFASPVGWVVGVGLLGLTLVSAVGYAATKNPSPVPVEKPAVVSNTAGKSVQPPPAAVKPQSSDNTKKTSQPDTKPETKKPSDTDTKTKTPSGDASTSHSGSGGGAAPAPAKLSSPSSSGSSPAGHTGGAKPSTVSTPKTTATVPPPPPATHKDPGVVPPKSLDPGSSGSGSGGGTGGAGNAATPKPADGMGNGTHTASLPPNQGATGAAQQHQPPASSPGTCQSVPNICPTS